MEKMRELLEKIRDSVDVTPLYRYNSDFNIFRILGVEGKEVIMCRYLADLLNPDGEHGYGFLFLKSFCENVIGMNHQSDALLSRTIVTSEYKLPDNRRIDIVISNHQHFVPIEVKIYAEEQENQCYDYYEYAVRHDSDAKLVYLTRFGSMPSEYSRKSLDSSKIKCIGWEKDIMPWLVTEREKVDDNMSYILGQYIDAIHEITDGREQVIMAKSIDIINESAELFEAAIVIEKSMKEAKLTLMKSVFDEFKRQMKPYCEKYGLSLEEKADYYLYDEDRQKKFYDENTYPGLNYVVNKAAFSNPNIQLWFRIEVNWNLYAGFTVYDFGAETQGNKIGYEVSEITDKIYQELEEYINSDIYIDCQNWWLTYCYPNGKIEESDYDDVPNFKRMNSCAISLADKDKREEYVKNSLLKFEEMLFKYLK